MKTKMTPFLIFLLSIIASGSVSAQEIQKYSLIEAQDYAVLNSYVVQNSGLDVDIARKRVWETITMGLPQVTGEANYTNFLNLPTQLIPGQFFGEPEGTFVPVQFGNDYSSDFGFSVNQLIFDGSYIVGIGSAKIYLQLATQTKEKTEIEIKHSVSQAYYMVLVAEENLSVMKGNLANSEKLFNDTKAFYENGFTEEQDADQMQLLVKRAENEISRAKREITIARMVLKYTMGVDVDSKIELTDNLDQYVDPLITSGDNNYGFDYVSHIDYRLLDTQLQVSKKLLRLEQSQYLPKVNGFYNWNKTAYGNASNLFKSSVPWFKSSILGVNISVPIFTGGQRISKVQQARMEYEKTSNDKKQAVQNLQREYLTAVVKLESAADQLRNDIDNKALSAKIYDKTTIKYNNGLVSSTELSQIESQYIQSQGAWVASVLQLLNAKISLERAIGK